MRPTSPNAYYPVFLSVTGRHCLVVGGGRVAAGKVTGLLAAGARVTVVSPELDSELNDLVTEKLVSHEARPYESRDLAGITLAMVATNKPGVNARVAADCRRAGVWVNVADDPAHCDFILPSVVRKGRITVAASTAGASPALAKWLRHELEAFLGDDLAALADLLAQTRAELLGRGIRVTADHWQAAIDDQLLALLRQGSHEEARRRLLTGLGAATVAKEAVTAADDSGGGDDAC